MLELLTSLQELLVAGWNVLTTLLGLLLPWTALFAWVAYWLFAVNWVKLREVMIQGGWIGVLLIGLMMVLVWGVVAPPVDGVHRLFGLSVSNFTGKTVYVTALFTIMFLCGSVQLSGACGPLAALAEGPSDDDHGDGHGHDHGHDHSHEHAGESHGHGHAAGH